MTTRWRGFWSGARRASAWCLAALLVLTWFPLGCAGESSSSADDASSGYTLVFTTNPPASVVSNAVIAPPVQVTVINAAGTVATNSSVTVSLAFAVNPSGATLGGTVSQTAVNGVATFSNLTVSKAGTGYVLSALAGNAMSVNSTAFNVVRALSFAAPTQLVSNTAAAPQQITSADFDGDGDDDLATVDGTNNQVQVFISNGNGTFQNAVNYPSASNPTAIVAANFDNDAFPDIAVAGADTVLFLPNQGNGTFGNGVPATTGNNASDIRGICAANFDSSGLNDVAISDANDNSIYVIRNDGGYTFTVQNFPSGGALSGPRAAVAADVNGDGVPDVAVANFGTRAQAVWINAGGNTLANLFPAGNASTVNMANPAGACQSILAADYNADGRADVFSPDDVQVNGQNQGNYFARQSNQTFAGPVINRVGQDPFGSAAADFNADGFPDIGVSTFLGLGGFGDLEVLLGNGNGTFQAVQAFPLANNESRSMAVGDFNNDNLPDAAISGVNTWVFMNTSQ